MRGDRRRPWWAGSGGHRGGWWDDCADDGTGDGSAPAWWPDNEQWPPQPGPGQQDWAGSWRRFARRAFATMLLVLVTPVALAAVLAATVGGWTSVVVALIGYAALVVILALVARFAVRSWRPVQSLMNAAGRVADGDYEARARTEGAAALMPMTLSFNRMAERLQSAEEERRRLLADIGHELRTPLTIIRGEVEAMIDGVHPVEPERLQLVLGDIAVMEHLLDDLRTLSTAEAGMLRVHTEPTDLVRLVDEVLARFATDARAGGVDLVAGAGTGATAVSGPSGGAGADGGVRVGVEAEVDPVRIGEVVANLVRNALRATPAGGTVSVTVEGPGPPRPEPRARTGPRPDGDAGADARPATTITVADTGRGIAPDDLERVFERFHKGPGSDGTGLGLTISRDLVEAHGGTLRLESTLGVGTTAVVTLPDRTSDAG